MARITCGHCKGTHDSVKAVRQCATSEPFVPAGDHQPFLAPLADAIGAKPLMPRLSERSK